MNLHLFLETVRADRARWEAALARVPVEQMESADLAGGWSVKDLLAHMTWFEREMVGVLRERSLAGGSPLWMAGQDERNRLIFEENRSRPLADVLAEAGEVHAELMAQLERLEEADLHDPARYAEMPPDWLPWQMLAGNTYEHYRDHARDLENWLDR